MTEAQLKVAKDRMKWYKKRDEDKIKTDEAKNGFEALVYEFRGWLREDENEAYVEEAQRESWIEKLNEMEDWLYEDGSDANHTVYRKKREELDKDFGVYQKRESFHREQDKTVDASTKVLTKIVEKVAEMAEKKPWIAEAARKDILDRVAEVRNWMEDELAKQAALKKHEDPVFSIALLADKMKKLQKLFKKVSQQPKPKEKKPEKKEEEKEEFAEGEDKKEEGGQTEGGDKKEEEKKEETKSEGDEKTEKTEKTEAEGEEKTADL